jgi:hypothetical protein
MDHIITEIICSLARAALSAFLSKELYTFIAVPSALLLSIVAYEALTRNPLRSSLPPFTGFQATWKAIQGRRRPQRDALEVVRLSFFGKDVFWVSRKDVMEEISITGKLARIMYGNGVVLVFNDKEKEALDKVVFF